MKKVLVLGAGLVAKPLIEYLLESGIRILVASPMKDRADEMINCHPLGQSADWSMDEPELLDKYVSEHDLTVSLLPYKFHTEVAKICIRHRKPLITTSYVQPGMKEMDADARRAGIIILNEIGLDPGIDHMSAMKIIDHIHGKNGKVEEFYSICGALPAPEAANNPLGYKFSWSPRGVILASRNSAQYLKDGKTVFVEPRDLFKDRFTTVFPGVGELEVYPNRDSISYRDIYGIPESLTVYRGTFRHKGWCETLDLMKTLNMLDDTPRDYTGYSFSRFISERASLDAPATPGSLANKLGPGTSTTAIKALDWLGFFSNSLMGHGVTTPFDITAELMIDKMTLGESERDMVVLNHTFIAEWADGKKEKIVSSMLDFGTPETNTSIARTVALPAAIASKLIIEGKIKVTGIHRPVIREIYEPVLEELGKLGIKMYEVFGLPV
ncbi:MAG: saccharopine dehydrogenase C-terminal domain-containing protein [Bacteroidales bacterium]